MASSEIGIRSHRHYPHNEQKQQHYPTATAGVKIGATIPLEQYTGYLGRRCLGFQEFSRPDEYTPFPIVSFQQHSVLRKQRTFHP